MEADEDAVIVPKPNVRPEDAPPVLLVEEAAQEGDDAKEEAPEEMP